MYQALRATAWRAMADNAGKHFIFPHSIILHNKEERVGGAWESSQAELS